MGLVRVVVILWGEGRRAWGRGGRRALGHGWEEGLQGRGGRRVWVPPAAFRLWERRNHPACRVEAQGSGSHVPFEQ